MLTALLDVKSTKVRFTLVIILLMNIWCTVEGKRARVKANKKKKSRGHMSGLYFVLGIMSLAILPVIFIFLYNVYKDPITPTLIKNGYELLRERSMGFLSKKKTAEEKED
ncbi:hypothetical protein B484DRAFT_399622 [Ochromonadaceae sp. CCMP2298]|nr:hypothetical protein B484DRAFT_399622 [Ochromonadaceae sp. CCMP2298]|mmetsp:Transcript_27528/g.60946  ORF Transcript_27528/g.60946 Transcript_27528/m.60946 type:complete len:110 (+) Transcript_27528:159-488(+)